MLLKEDLEKFCEQYEDAKLYVEDKKVNGLPGSFISITKYQIEIIYKEYLIRVSNELGNHNLGEIEVDLKHEYIPDFEITTRNHFINLFLRKKGMFIIKCDVEDFKMFLHNAAISSNLENIAKENSFEPKINSIKEKNIQFIKTQYSLQLEDKLGALKAIIEFYKLIIEKF